VYKCKIFTLLRQDYNDCLHYFYDLLFINMFFFWFIIIILLNVGTINNLNKISPCLLFILKANLHLVSVILECNHIFTLDIKLTHNGIKYIHTHTCTKWLSLALNIMYEGYRQCRLHLWNNKRHVLTLRIYPAVLKINNDVCNIFQVLDRKSVYLIEVFRVVSIQVAGSWDFRVCAEGYKSWRRNQRVQLRGWYLFIKVLDTHFRRLWSYLTYLIFDITSFVRSSKMMCSSKTNFPWSQFVIKEHYVRDCCENWYWHT
jgi:hypothetical protein